ncbi:MAG TPA: hypothetical protein VKE42_09090 [Candidatus Cybelea sp.]|nr:hypothetical protein [Candidatus Cybelea sp.]
MNVTEALAVVAVMAFDPAFPVSATAAEREALHGEAMRVLIVHAADAAHRNLPSNVAQFAESKAPMAYEKGTV